MRRLRLKETWGSPLRISLPPRPALRLFAPSTGFLLLLCAQLADFFLGGVVLGRVGAHRRWPPSHALAMPTVSWWVLTTGAGRPNENPGIRSVCDSGAPIPKCQDTGLRDRCNGEIDDGKVGEPATPGVKT